MAIAVASEATRSARERGVRDPIATYFMYSAAWSDRDAVQRMRVLEQTWADDGAFFDEETSGGLFGPAALSEYIAATHEEMPGLVVVETSPHRSLVIDSVFAGWLGKTVATRTRGPISSSLPATDASLVSRCSTIRHPSRASEESDLHVNIRAILARAW